MKPPPFRYLAAGSVEETLALLAEHGSEARLLAGGQSLVPLLNFRLSQPSVLVDINRLEECCDIRLEDGFLSLGGLTRLRQMELSPLVKEQCPLLSEAAPYIGHVAIRNRGTVGGSLAHAHPAGELPALALALDAELVVQSSRGTRVVPAEEFFVSVMTTALRSGELLTQVRIPVPRRRPGYGFLEVARRHGDFALAGVTCLLTPSPDGGEQIAAARVVLMGVGDVPLRARKAEILLTGERADGQVFQAAAASVAEEVDPISDLHGSARYRRHLCGVLTRQALERAWAESKGGLSE